MEGGDSLVEIGAGRDAEVAVEGMVAQEEKIPMPSWAM